MVQHEKRGWSINQHLFCNSLVKTVKNNNWPSGQNNWETFLVQNVSRDLYQHKLFTGNKGKLRLCYFSKPSFLIPVFLFSISYTLLYFSLNKRFPDRIWNIIFVKKRASCSSFRSFDKPIYQRQVVFYNMVQALLNCSHVQVLVSTL